MARPVRVRRSRRRVSNVCRDRINRHIKIHLREGMPRDQAVAVAYSEARERGCKLPPRPRRHPEAQHDKGDCCMCGGDHCCCTHE